MIAQDDFDFIARFDGATDPKTREAVVKENPSQLAKTFFNLFNSVSKDQTVQYLLTLLDDVLQEDKNRVDIFKVSAVISTTRLPENYCSGSWT
jgi:V-type H+-transporting ATPase subunit H